MRLIAGVDEVGRGSLIGPVYAAAVILNKTVDKKLIKDSKSLNKSSRELLSKYIKKNSIWAVGRASVTEIEKKNILQASLLAMKRAIKKLKKKPSQSIQPKAQKCGNCQNKHEILDCFYKIDEFLMSKGY